MSFNSKATTNRKSIKDFGSPESNRKSTRGSFFGSPQNIQSAQDFRRSGAATPDHGHCHTHRQSSTHNDVVMKDGKFQANWLGIQTELTNAHAVKHSQIVKTNLKKGKDVKKVRMSLAEKEHIWRICKKWVNDDDEISE